METFTCALSLYGFTMLCCCDVYPQPTCNDKYKINKADDEKAPESLHASVSLPLWLNNTKLYIPGSFYRACGGLPCV